MCSAVWHETSSLQPRAYRRGARPADGWLALVGGGGAAPLPERVGQCPRRAGAPDRLRGGLLGEDRTAGPPALGRGGHRRAAPRLLAPPPGTCTGRCGRAGRAAPRAVAPQPARVRPCEQSLWTWDLAAQVSGTVGLTATRVSGETLRQPLQRL